MVRGVRADDAIRKLWSAVLVQESGEHGGTAAGPVVRDIVKAYYDKKNKKTTGPGDRRNDKRRSMQHVECRKPEWQGSSAQSCVEDGRTAEVICRRQATEQEPARRGRERLWM